MTRVEKCTSLGSLSPPLSRVMVQCNRRKPTCANWVSCMCVCVCVCLCGKANMNIMSAFILLGMLVHNYFQSALLLHEESTLFISELFHTVSAFIFTTLTVTVWGKKNEILSRTLILDLCFVWMSADFGRVAHWLAWMLAFFNMQLL